MRGREKVIPYFMAVRVFIILIFAAAGSQAFSQAQCDAGAFREAVASASASITQLHEKNNRVFQEKLQRLRTVNNWTDAEYVAMATPFVKDDTIASLDQANQALLAKVQSLEAVNADTETGRCAMLKELRVAMEMVVANTAAKWDHMISKLTMAATGPTQADASR
jgi:hypothetical protein